MTHVYDPAKRRAELTSIVAQFRDAIECYSSVLECGKLLGSELDSYSRGWQLASVHAAICALRREARSLLYELDVIEGGTK